MVTDSFLIHIKTEDVYEDISNDFFKKTAPWMMIIVIKKPKEQKNV